MTSRGPARPPRCSIVGSFKHADHRGFSVLEMLLSFSLILIVGGVALALFRSTVEESRTWSASYHMSGRLALARMESVKRARAVALRFESGAPDYRYRFYVDGNGNGVRTDDIARGIDRPLLFNERLTDFFRGVTFGIGPGLAPLDPGEPLVPGSDPIRIGSSRILTFTPRGTATSGTLFIRGPSEQQYAVRVLGTTGRTRVLRFERASRQWIGP